jgi:hypothetical protein
MKASPHGEDVIAEYECAVNGVWAKFSPALLAEQERLNRIDIYIRVLYHAAPQRGYINQIA